MLNLIITDMDGCNELVGCKSFGKSFESLENDTKKDKGYLEILFDFHSSQGLMIHASKWAIDLTAECIGFICGTIIQEH